MFHHTLDLLFSARFCCIRVFPLLVESSYFGRMSAKLVDCDLGRFEGRWMVNSNIFELYKDVVRMEPRGGNDQWHRLVDEKARESDELLELEFCNRQRGIENEGGRLSFERVNANTARPTCRACRGGHLVQYCHEALDAGFCWGCEDLGHSDWECPAKGAASASQTVSTVLPIGEGVSERDVPLFIKLAKSEIAWTKVQTPWTAVGLNGQLAKIVFATTVPFSVIFLGKAKELKLPWQAERWERQLEFTCLGSTIRVFGEMVVNVDFGAVERELRVLVAEDVALVGDFGGVFGMDFLELYGAVRFCPRERKIEVFHQLLPGKKQNTKLWMRRLTRVRVADWQYIRRGGAVMNGPIRHQ